MNSPSNNDDYELSKESEQPYQAAEVTIPIKPDLRDAKREMRDFFDEINGRIEDTKKKMEGMGVSQSNQQTPEQQREQRQFGERQSERDERAFDPILLALSGIASDVREMKNGIEQLVAIAQTMQNQ